MMKMNNTRRSIRKYKSQSKQTNHKDHHQVTNSHILSFSVSEIKAISFALGQIGAKGRRRQETPKPQAADSESQYDTVIAANESHYTTVQPELSATAAEEPKVEDQEVVENKTLVQPTPQEEKPAENEPVAEPETVTLAQTEPTAAVVVEPAAEQAVVEVAGESKPTPIISYADLMDQQIETAGVKLKECWQNLEKTKFTEALDIVRDALNILYDC